MRLMSKTMEVPAERKEVGALPGFREQEGLPLPEPYLGICGAGSPHP